MKVENLANEKETCLIVVGYYSRSLIAIILYTCSVYLFQAMIHVMKLFCIIN